MTVQDADGLRVAESRRTSVMIGPWPIGVLIVATLRIVDAVTLAAAGLAIRGAPTQGLPLLASSAQLTQTVDFALAFGILVGVVGLLLFRRWGWVVTMGLVGLGLLAELARVWIGQPDHLSLLLLVVSAFYLNQRSVRAMAGHHLSDDGPT